MTVKKRSLHSLIFIAMISVSLIGILTIGGVFLILDAASNTSTLPPFDAQNGSIDTSHSNTFYFKVLALICVLISTGLIAAFFSRLIYQQINNELDPLLSNIQKFARDNQPIATNSVSIKEFETIAKTANQFAQHRDIQFKELQRLSQRDPLTDLYNRRHMSEILILEEARIKRNKGCFGLIIADIDHFKSINDTYGHEAGDKTIRAISSLLINTLRKQDLVSRWGGEEFLILLPDASPIATLRVAEKICQAANQLIINHKSHQIQLTLTCGATYHDGKLELSESIDRADQALYEGKRGGRNRVVPKAPMDFSMAASA